MNLHKMAVGARLLLPVYVAGMLFIQNPIPDPMLLILTLLQMCAIVMFCDQNTQPLKSRAWFNVETFVRVALVCSAMVNARDSQQGYSISLMGLFIFQMLAMAVQGSNKTTSRVSMGAGLGIAVAVQLAWLAAYQLGKNEPQLQWSIPAAPLWLIATTLCGSMVLVRENVWTSLAGTRLLSDGQRKFMWTTILNEHEPPQYWTLVHNYFRDMQWGPKRPWLDKELDAAVAAAPMEYLLAYMRVYFYHEYTAFGITQWSPSKYFTSSPHAKLYTAMLLAIEARMQALDNRAAIAWSMATSSKEALGLFERMLNAREPQETLELPAL